MDVFLHYRNITLEGVFFISHFLNHSLAVSLRLYGAHNIHWLVSRQLCEFLFHELFLLAADLLLSLFLLIENHIFFDTDYFTIL